MKSAFIALAMILSIPTGAAASEDKFQDALNFVFTGHVQPDKPLVKIFDREKCVVWYENQNIDSSFSSGYFYLNNWNLKTVSLWARPSVFDEDTIVYHIVFSSDSKDKPATSPNKSEGKIALYGEALQNPERAMTALALIFKNFCTGAEADF